MLSRMVLREDSRRASTLERYQVVSSTIGTKFAMEFAGGCDYEHGHWRKLSTVSLFNDVGARLDISMPDS